jgi:trans-aconitate 2-methyltransferase
MPRDWDATAYERMSTPLEAMGRAVLDRLELTGHETVLDVGCGTGRVTALLHERLPEGRVIAVDASPAMVEAARARLDPERSDAFVADLTELELPEPVDAILSTATFHWIADHDRLFQRLHAALKPGGQLVAQCGGAGNIRDVLESLEIASRDFPGVRGWSPWNFATPEETELRLRAAGFSDVRTWRSEWPVEVDEPRAYFTKIMLGSHLERLPEDRQEAFVDAVLAHLRDPIHVGYVRLNIDARK